MNAKGSVFVICVEAIKHLLLYNLHDSTFKRLSVFRKGRKCLTKQLLLTLIGQFYHYIETSQLVCRARVKYT